MKREDMERLWERSQDPPADDVGLVIARFGVRVARFVQRETVRRAKELARPCTRGGRRDIDWSALDAEIAKENEDG